MRRLIMALFLMVAIVLGAAAGFVLLAGWSLADAIYFVIVTVFSVGYEELHPINTPFLRLFNSMVIVAGAFAVVYIMAVLVQMMTQGEIQRIMGARRMTRGIESQTGHVIVCGFGRLGQILAKRLHQARFPFVIVDSSEERREAAEAEGYLVVLGNAVDEEALRAAGIRRAKHLASVLPNDADNVFIALTARTLNPNIDIIARGEIPSTEAKLRAAGANHVILPAAIGGYKIADLVLRPKSADMLDHVGHESTIYGELRQIGMKLTELTVKADSPAKGRPVGSFAVKGEEPFLLVAVRHASGVTDYDPVESLVVQEGEVLVLIGRATDTPRIELVEQHP